MDVIPDRLYFRIGDVSDIAGVKPYVLRYWETEFPMISPQKSSSGQRVYRRTDVETVLMIKHLLYEERYSIDGARRRIRELRREGDLRTFRQETAAQQAANPSPSPRESGVEENASDKLASAVAESVVFRAPCDDVPATEPAVSASTAGREVRREALEAILTAARELKSLAETPFTQICGA